MDQKSIEAKLSDLPLGGIRYFETIDSTNNQAASWAAQGAPDLSLVLANEQIAGRGRGDRKWFTYPGSSLAFSLILRPIEIPQEEQAEIMPRFTGVGAVGVCEALQNRYGLPAEIKWPNDVLINRRKACGILAEAQWIGDLPAAVILGVGINVAPGSVPMDSYLLFPATCVEAELQKEIDRIELLHITLAEILQWRNRLMTDALIQSWEANLAYRGEQVQILSSSPEPCVIYDGHLLGLKPDGALKLLAVSGDVITIRGGEIDPEESRIRLRPVDSLSK